MLKTYALTIYRISKELIMNAVKHSEGTQVDLLLEEDADKYYIQVKDNGIGFPVREDEALLNSPHMGLYTVKRRIAELSGHMDIYSAPGAGTKFYIYIPKQEV